MKNETVRNIIALMVVGIFVLITDAMILFPLFSTANVNVLEYSDYFAKTAGIYTTLIHFFIEELCINR